MAVVNKGVDAVNKYIFQHREIDVLFDDDTSPWFKAKNVAEILGYSNTNDAIRLHVKDKYCKKYQELKGDKSRPLLNQHPHTVYINEPGLYSLIMTSKMPIADQFRDWVFEHVLPSIRKYGIYKLECQNMEQLKSINRLTNALTRVENENKQLQTTMRNMESRVAVIPKRHQLKHAFCVLRTDVECYADKKFLHKYKCIRTQNRNLHQTKRNALREGYKVYYCNLSVPNSMNTFNRVKEIMRQRGICYEAYYNTVYTTEFDFVGLVQEVLDEVVINKIN